MTVRCAVSETREALMLVRVETEGERCARRCEFNAEDILWCRLFLVEPPGEDRRCPECLRTFGDDTVRR